MVLNMMFGKPEMPCDDCWDGHCTMNCSRPLKPRVPAEVLTETGVGKAFVEYETKTNAAWVQDEKLGESYRPSKGSLKRARDLWKEADAARAAFVEMLSKALLP